MRLEIWSQTQPVISYRKNFYIGRGVILQDLAPAPAKKSPLVRCHRQLGVTPRRWHSEELIESPQTVSRGRHLLEKDLCVLLRLCPHKDLRHHAPGWANFAHLPLFVLVMFCSRKENKPPKTAAECNKSSARLLAECSQWSVQSCRRREHSARRT